MKKLLIIISACNEAVSLEVFLPRLFKVINILNLSTEVLVVSDGSKDNTAEIAKANNCRVIENARNLGIGSSLRLGYKIAINEGFDFTVTMDADGQHDAAILPNVVNLLTEDKADIVVASRYHKDSERFGVPIDRDFLNISLTAQMKVATGWNTTDPLSGFWGMTKPYFKFAFENGRQARYGIHLENLINFWYLCDQKPRHVEVPHPAIYDNHGTHLLLTREYSNANQEQRIDRFGTHPHQIFEVIGDVCEKIGNRIYEEIEGRRRNLFL